MEEEYIDQERVHSKLQCNHSIRIIFKFENMPVNADVKMKLWYLQYLFFV